MQGARDAIGGELSSVDAHEGTRQSGGELARNEWQGKACSVAERRTDGR